jgi:hypothetical protein
VINNSFSLLIVEFLELTEGGENVVWMVTDAGKAKQGEAFFPFFPSSLSCHPSPVHIYTFPLPSS